MESASTPEAPQQSKESPIVSFGKRLLMIALAAVFMYFAFKGCNLSEVWRYAQRTNLFFVFLILVVSVIANLIRAARWIILLKPSKEKISMWNSFFAIMVGYCVNLVVPRGGEVARLLSLSRSENIPWAAVLPTMLIDRLLDVAMLVLLLGMTLAVLPPSVLKEMPWLLPGGGLLIVATVIGLALLPKAGAIGKWVLTLSFVSNMVPANLKQKVNELIEQFDRGAGALADPVAYPAIAIMSVLIWATYYVTVYLMVLAFDLGSRVSPVQALTVFTIGSIGVLVPTPGSVGSFHLLTSKALVMASGVDQNLAVAFAAVFHFISFIFNTCVVTGVLAIIQAFRTPKKEAK